MFVGDFETRDLSGNYLVRKIVNKTASHIFWMNNLQDEGQWKAAILVLFFPFYILENKREHSSGISLVSHLEVMQKVVEISDLAEYLLWGT